MNINNETAGELLDNNKDNESFACFLSKVIDNKMGRLESTINSDIVVSDDDFDIEIQNDHQVISLDFDDLLETEVDNN